MISSRQETLLSSIIKEYVDSARPVSSGLIVKHEGFNLSPATIRNEMAELTAAGYLQQPHTSAGRMPTEKAWKWYVANLLKEKELSERQQKQVTEAVKDKGQSEQELLRQLAKTMADLVEETVIVGFNRNDTYYTGLSNLFRQPEFEHLDMIQNMTEVVDRLDEVMATMFDRIQHDIQVLVGRENPFSPDCGVVITRYAIPHHHSGVISILGPMRQDYDRHVAMVRYAQHLLQTV